MLLCDCLITDLLGLVIALAVLVISLFKWKFTYWQKRNVPYVEPSIPFGNLANPFTATETLGIVVKNVYDSLKARNSKHGGFYFFGSPSYMPIDLNYVKNILTKDFHHFSDRGFYHNEEDDPLSANIFTVDGSRWRNLRMKLTPTFTSGKMKMMFQTLVDCEEGLHGKINKLGESKQPINIKDILGCYTTDIIGSCAFGLDCKTFQDDDSPFRKYGKKFFEQSNLERLKTSFSITFPNIARALKMRLIPEDIADFFFEVVKDTVQYREKNNFVKNDFMQLLIDLKNNKLAQEEGYQHDGKTLTMDELTAQCFLFFIAGFETSSTAMTFVLYELSKNQDIQDKVRQEINHVLKKHDDKVTYDAIQEMKYLSQVINETLRKYPPVPILGRQCVEDYKVPDENLILEKGSRVTISILGIHHDEEHYPDPEKFDPERFNEENIRSRHQYAYIPFGEGPRNCIGLRFGLMQSKVGLTSLLRKYNFTLSKKTKQPLKLDVNSVILSADGDIWLDAEKIVN